ncbi:UNKNOWN [Stylonychia lemnae]|uniref:Uncharacterized protein n=1 Tax=Stylonychia lemnae TaxID=5949 RepID=A0A078ABP3_STYLE|nr:UNKNOWN [Stylonychia lemnae]|eukprot:CDW79715.1 UNKNOWN [Stylonychia lemnae]
MLKQKRPMTTSNVTLKLQIHILGQQEIETFRFKQIQLDLKQPSTTIGIIARPSQSDLEHQILPKNSLMLRQLCELASTNQSFIKSHFNEFVKKNTRLSKKGTLKSRGTGVGVYFINNLQRVHQLKKVDLQIDSSFNINKAKLGSNQPSTNKLNQEDQKQYVNQHHLKVHVPIENTNLSSFSRGSNTQNAIMSQSFIQSPQVITQNSARNNIQSSQTNTDKNVNVLLSPQSNNTTVIFQETQWKNAPQVNLDLPQSEDNDTSLNDDLQMPKVTKYEPPKSLRKKIFSAHPKNRRQDVVNNYHSNSNNQFKQIKVKSKNTLLNQTMGNYDPSSTELVQSDKEGVSDMQSQMDAINEIQSNLLDHNIYVQGDAMSPIKVKNYQFKNFGLNQTQVFQTQMHRDQSNSRVVSPQSINHQSGNATCKSGLSTKNQSRYNKARRSLKSAGRARIKHDLIHDEKQVSLKTQRANLNIKSKLDNNPNVRFRYYYRDHMNKQSIRENSVSLMKEDDEKRKFMIELKQRIDHPGLNPDMELNLNSNSDLLSEQLYKSQLENQVKSQVLNSFYRNNVRFDMKQDSEIGQSLLQGINMTSQNVSDEKRSMGMQTYNKKHSDPIVIKEADTIQERNTLDKQSLQVYNENINSTRLLGSGSLIHISCSTIQQPNLQESHPQLDIRVYTGISGPNDIKKMGYIKSVYLHEKDAASKGLINEFSYSQLPQNRLAMIKQQYLNTKTMSSENDQETTTLSEQDVKLQQQLLKKFLPSKYKNLNNQKNRLNKDFFSPASTSIINQNVFTPQGALNRSFGFDAKNLKPNNFDSTQNTNQNKMSYRNLKEIDRYFDEQRLYDICFKGGPSTFKMDHIQISQKINELIKKESETIEVKDINVQTSQKTSPHKRNIYRDRSMEDNINISGFDIKVSESPHRMNGVSFKNADFRLQDENHLSYSKNTQVIGQRKGNFMSNFSRAKQQAQKKNLQPNQPKAKMQNFNTTFQQSQNQHSNIDLIRSQQKKFLIDEPILNSSKNRSKNQSFLKTQPLHKDVKIITQNVEYMGRMQQLAAISMSREQSRTHLKSASSLSQQQSCTQLRKKSVTELLFSNTNLQKATSPKNDVSKLALIDINSPKSPSQVNQQIFVDEFNLKGIRAQINKTPKSMANPLGIMDDQKSKDHMLIGLQQNQEVMDYIQNIGNLDFKNSQMHFSHESTQNNNPNKTYRSEMSKSMMGTEDDRRFPKFTQDIDEHNGSIMNLNARFGKININ